MAWGRCTRKRTPPPPPTMHPLRLLQGSLNKIPVSIIGLFLFESTWSMSNLMSVLIGMGAGVMFVLAKQRANS